MGISDDVLVVGGGLAGMTAALAAADAGASVRVVTKSESTLQQASGLIDVLGYPTPHEHDAERAETAPSDGPLANPFEGIDALPETHPYRVVGTDALRDGLALFDDAVGDLYAGAHTDRNALVPTVGGTIKPTARYPTSVAPGLASDDAAMAIVGFEGDTDVDGPRIAAHLRATGVPFDVVGATISFPGDLDGTDQRTRLAHALDADEDDARVRLADRATRAIDAACGDDGKGPDTALTGTRDVERVAFPAVLGRDHPTEVRETVSRRLDADAFEIPPTPPSLPGLRLRYRLRDALRDAGVALTTGVPVVDYDTAEASSASDATETAPAGASRERITTVYADRNGTTVPYDPGAVVLATGGLVGEGIDSERDRVYEPVFDCHVPHPDDRYEWSDADTFGPHAFARFGVDITPDGLVRDADGGVAYGNLAAAGGVVGNADPAAEKSASGISLATGVTAGTTAARIAADTHQPAPATGGTQ